MDKPIFIRCVTCKDKKIADDFRVDMRKLNNRVSECLDCEANRLKTRQAEKVEQSNQYLVQ